MSKGERTREKILSKAISLASVCGLQDLSIGKLASETRLSKSGLFAHFNSKENLQTQIIQRVRDLFVEKVLMPAISQPRGVPRIRAIFGNWKRWIDGGSIPGGCLALASALEFDDRPGAVRAEVVGMMRSLLEMIERAADIAVEEGHFRPDADTRQFAFEFNAIICGYHLGNRLLKDPEADGRSEEALGRLLASFGPPGATTEQRTTRS
ncbi:MAG: TetR/AcrR family transcriptional regulator [bacterium]|nr:MAG: TetR/AcrR family transcriptional regulator [bacterium]